MAREFNLVCFETLQFDLAILDVNLNGHAIIQAYGDRLENWEQVLEEVRDLLEEMDHLLGAPELRERIEVVAVADVDERLCRRAGALRGGS